MTLLKNNEAREAIPGFLKPLVEEHFKALNGALLVADSAMIRLHQRRLLTDEIAKGEGTVSAIEGIRLTYPEPKAEHSSFWLKTDASDDYKNDGSTRTPGTHYQFLWIYELVNRDPETYQNALNDWYRGRLSCAIAHEFEVQVRDSDERVRAGGASLSFGGIGIGHQADHEEKNVRIAYSTSGNTCHVGAYAIANLVELVVKLRERVRAVEVVKSLLPKGER